MKSNAIYKVDLHLKYLWKENAESRTIRSEKKILYSQGLFPILHLFRDRRDTQEIKSPPYSFLKNWARLAKSRVPEQQGEEVAELQMVRSFLATQAAKKTPR